MCSCDGPGGSPLSQSGLIGQNPIDDVVRFNSSLVAMCTTLAGVRRCVWSKYHNSYQISNFYTGNILMTQSTNCDWADSNGGRAVMDCPETVRRFWKAAIEDDDLIDSLVVNSECLPEVSETVVNHELHPH